jgi:hypothetical protein
MKKYVMNKNVMHDGKQFLKGDEIDGKHPLVADGHADELVFKGEAVGSADEPSFPEPEVEVEEKHHSKKHGRK